MAETKTLIRCTVVLFAGAVALTKAISQTAPDVPKDEVPGAAAGQSKAVVEMSPFEVQTSQDTGYAAPKHHGRLPA